MSKVVNFNDKIIQNFIEERRPPVELRDRLDLHYTFENQVVEIFEIRPFWNDPSKKDINPIAKSRFIKSKNVWKIYWLRGNGKWNIYKPHEEAKDLSEFLEVVDIDQFACFWG